jgi:rhodanese-related sulfurtransferase
LILDGTDNFSTRYLVNDASILTNTPLVYGSIYKFEGQFSVFNFNNGPSYRCLFPTPPAAGTVLNCSEIGVLGVLPGVIGTQMANEALKIILGIGEVLTGKLMLYNALETTYTKLTIPRSSDEIEKVHAQSPLFEEYDYDLFCGVDRVLAPNELNLDMFRNYINHSDYIIIDLREEWELPELSGENVVNMGMDELKRIQENVPVDKQIILACQTGYRSAQAQLFLTELLLDRQILHLKGGLENYDGQEN